MTDGEIYASMSFADDAERRAFVDAQRDVVEEERLIDVAQAMREAYASCPPRQFTLVPWDRVDEPRKAEWLAQASAAVNTLRARGDLP